MNSLGKVPSGFDPSLHFVSVLVIELGHSSSEQSRVVLGVLQVLAPAHSGQSLSVDVPKQVKSTPWHPLYIVIATYIHIHIYIFIFIYLFLKLNHISDICVCCAALRAH